MKTNFNLKSYFVFLLRNKLYTAINIFGFGISLAFVILISLYYQHETGYDKDLDKVFSLVVDVKYGGKSSTSAGTSYTLVKAIKRDIPQADKVAAAYCERQNNIQKEDGELFPAEVMFASKDFMTMFGYEIVAGSKEETLEEKGNVIVSEEFAMKYYGGSEKALGRPLTMMKQSVRITAVFKKKENTHMHDFDMLASFELFRNTFEALFRPDGNFGSVGIFMTLDKGADIEAVSEVMNKYMKERYKDWKILKNMESRIVRFPDTYLSQISSMCFRNNSPVLITILFIICMVILVFSVLNYVNMTIAQSWNRTHEMATRRLLGSTRSSIMMRLMSESFVICIISLIVGILISASLSPSVPKLLDVNIDILDIVSAKNMLLLLLLITAISVISGIAPSMVISGVKPIDIVRGTVRKKNKMTFSKVFIVVQNIVTISLLSCAFSLIAMRYILIETDFGYDFENVIELRLPVEKADHNKLFKDKITALPIVESASLCNCSPIFFGFNQVYNTEGSSVMLQRFYADTDYFRTLRLNIIKGNKNHPLPGVYTARSTHQKMGLSNNTTLKIYDGDEPVPVAGMVEDVVIGTSRMQHNVRNMTMVLYIGNKNYDGVDKSHIIIRVKERTDDSYATIAKVYEDVYGSKLQDSTPYLSDVHKNSLSDMDGLINIVNLFTILTLIISILGLIAMSLYYVSQRKRDMAIRKVFGSNNREINIFIIKRFISLILLSFTIASVISYIVIMDLASNIVTDFVCWPYIILAGMLVMLVSALAVFSQSYAAGRSNPADNLKAEN